MGDGSCHVHGANNMFEAGVDRAWVDEVRPSQLVDSPEPLDSRGVDQLPLNIGHLDVAVNRIPDFCDRFQCRGDQPF